MGENSGNINITVEASTITDAQLVGHHISQYLQSTGFTDVNVSQNEPQQFPDPSSQSEAIQAIRRLNPDLLATPVNIDCGVFQWGPDSTPDAEA